MVPSFYMRHGVILWLIVNLMQDNTVAYLSTSSVTWAPLYRKAVYMTFLNHLHKPTWRTRSQFTRAPAPDRHRRLAYGVPYAFICGACFTVSHLPVNLTLHANNGLKVDFQPLYYKSKEKMHPSVRDDVCLVSYGITAPIVDRGRLTCRLNRGTRTFEEHLDYSVTTAPFLETEEKTVFAKGGKAKLVCQKVEHKTDGLIYVWHYLDEQEPKIVVPSLNETVTVSLTSDNEKIACSAYDSANPGQVDRIPYLLKGEVVEHETEEWVVGAGEYKDEEKPISLSKIALIVGGVVGFFILTAVVITLYNLCRKPMGESKKIQSPLIQSNHP